jgi:hypothetical protein
VASSKCDDQACCDAIARDTAALRASEPPAALGARRRLSIVVLHPLTGERASAAIRPAVEIAVCDRTRAACAP